MNDMQRAEMNDIVERIVASVPVSEVYLFGSFAKGIERENSDFDFYVVIPDDSGMREGDADFAIRQNLRGKRNRSVDMLIGKQSKFNRRKNYFYSIENEIIETGVKLHG